jgi:hypothetical protein
MRASARNPGMMYRDEREKQHSPSSFFSPFFIKNFYLDLLHIPQKFIEH